MTRKHLLRRRIQRAFQFSWKCRQCVIENSDSAKLFPSRESLWRDHLFEPFLRWVNEVLAPARWLRVSRTKGTTWAELIRDESALSNPSSTLLLIQQLKRIDGGLAHDSNTEAVSNGLIPLARIAPGFEEVTGQSQYSLPRRDA